ncbi:mycE [Symbiodinium sp. CCMP2592]|nr:mycE [Symbiodinium sp. CCMP2592]
MDFQSMPEPEIAELPKLRIFSYSWPEMLHLPLLLRCAEQRQRQSMASQRRTCATKISETYCGLLHRRPAYTETTTEDPLPSLGSCNCMNAALEAGVSGVSWNWQQLSNVAFLKLQLARHELLFWSGLTMDTMTNILFGMPHSVMGFFGHPSLLELLRRRAFYEDTQGLECSDRDDCRAKRVLTLIEWLMLARNVFCQHGALSTWELASNEQSIDLIDFRRHTLLVDTMFVELLSDAQDSTWGPSIELLLNVLQEELAVDFGLKFRETSPWCSTNISAESANREPARLFTDLDFSWFSKLCALSLEPQQTSEATEAVDLEPPEPHIAEEPSTCHASDTSEGSPLRMGDLLFHVLGHAVVSPQHRLTDSAMEVEVLLFVYSLDGCIPVVREKIGHVLSQPAVPLFPWRCSFDGWSGQAVPVSMMGFTRTIVRPVPAWIRQPSLLRLFAEPQDIQLPISLCQKQSQPKERLRLAICLRIHYDIRGLESGLPYLVRDWMNFHLLSGVDKFVIYDEDGSFSEVEADLSRHPRVSYFPHWPETSLPLLSSRLQLGKQEVGKDSLAAQANSHCVMMLKGQVDWIAMLPGFDTFLWTSQSSSQTGALKAVLATVEPHRPKLAALQLMEVQYTQGNYKQGSTLLSQRMRGPSITNQSHTLLLNPETRSLFGRILVGQLSLFSPVSKITSHLVQLSLTVTPDNVLEVGMGHFALPRHDAHLVVVEESRLRVNHYIDFVESSGSRCVNCTILDDALSPELESELEMMRQTT